MADITNTRRLWVANRHNTFLVLAQDGAGTPTLIEPCPLLHKAVYVSASEATGDFPSVQWSTVNTATLGLLATNSLQVTDSL